MLEPFWYTNCDHEEVKLRFCSIIAPRQYEMVIGWDDYLAECIVPAETQHSTHVIKTPAGDHFAWEDDFTCDCCGPEEDDRCYVYWEVEDEDVPKLLAAAQ